MLKIITPMDIFIISLQWVIKDNIMCEFLCLIIYIINVNLKKYIFLVYIFIYKKLNQHLGKYFEESVAFVDFFLWSDCCDVTLWEENIALLGYKWFIHNKLFWINCLILTSETDKHHYVNNSNKLHFSLGYIMQSYSAYVNIFIGNTSSSKTAYFSKTHIQKYFPCFLMHGLLLCDLIKKAATWLSIKDIPMRQKMFANLFWYMIGQLICTNQFI